MEMSVPHLMMCVAVARGLDLFTTWMVSPDLRLECNPFISLLGWRCTIALNLVAIPALAMWPAGAIVCIVLSVIAVVINLNNAIK